MNFLSHELFFIINKQYSNQNKTVRNYCSKHANQYSNGSFTSTDVDVDLDTELEGIDNKGSAEDSEIGMYSL